MNEYKHPEELTIRRRASPFSLKNKLGRVLWALANTLLFRPSPRIFHEWRNILLRLFGAQIDRGTRIYPKARIWAPWNLVCHEFAGIADGAIVYNPASMTLGAHCVISQEAYLCGATHDYNDPAFPLIAHPMSLGAYCWICARASVLPGVNVGEGAILALGSVATRDLVPWTIYAGVPAKAVKPRHNWATPVREITVRSSYSE
jgi:putative colanic acid biosynthesis acetyltransferase WcaF